MKQWYDNKILWALLVILVVGGFFLFNRSEVSDSAMTSEEVEVNEGEMSVTGVVACLPYRVATPGQDCVKALKGDDGKMYALNSTSLKAPELNMALGTKVRAVGVFEAANTSVDDSSVFRYDGVLILSSLKKS